MASKVTPKEKLVSSNKTMKAGGMKKGGGSKTGMQEPAKVFKKNAMLQKGGKK